MRFNEFIGPTYSLKSFSIECQRCVNMYPQIDEAGTEKDQGVAALLSTPGLRLLNSISTAGNATTAVRGAYVAQNNVLYMVVGNTLYALDSSFRAFQIGLLGQLPGTGPISMADNGTSLMIVDSPSGFWCDLAPADSIVVLNDMSSDPNWQGSTMVACADGMFVFNVPDTFEFYVSDILSTTINPLGLASRETPDNIVGFIWDKRNLWLFGQKSTELWYDSGGGVGGTTGNPFQVIQGGFIEVGCTAAFSIVQLANTIIWLGQDPRGDGVVFMADGYSPKRISNHSVELAIQSYSNITDAVAWTYQQNGHNFYAINFPSANTTWVFDMSTGMWHERAFTNTTTGQLERHRAQVHAFAYGTHVVGDYENGNIYELDGNVYSDDSNPITRLRASPHLSNDMNRIFFHKFQLDFQPGQGIDGEDQGSDPQAILQFSDDGGYTWSNEMWVTLGKIGEFKKRAIWRRLGQGRNRVFRVIVTDPIDVTMIGAEVDASGGTS